MINNNLWLLISIIEFVAIMSAGAYVTRKSTRMIVWYLYNG